METVHYVNAPAGERRNRPEPRETRHSGRSKIYVLVGIGFGLLCIIQFALNVSLRLHDVWSSSRSDNSSTCNFTMMSVLMLEREQLIQERDQLVQERDQLVQERDQLVQERDQLDRENSRLVRDRNRLVRERNQLDWDKNRLAEDQKMLNNRVTELVRELKTHCPQGWWPYKSTCYQRSFETNTWEHAKQDCERKGSHLVILKDQEEEVIVGSFGVAVKMWMGLSVQKDTSSSWKWPWTWTWTWVDGSPLSSENWNCWNPEFSTNQPNSCAYVDLCPSSLKTWGVDNCQQQHYWMCEKQLHQ